MGTPPGSSTNNVHDARSITINHWGAPENSGVPLSPQDQYENKTYRVVKEFDEGQQAYGYEGLCVRAVQTEEGQARLTLLGTDAKKR